MKDWDAMAHRHSSLLVTPDGSGEESPICFEVGDGWYDLLETLWGNLDLYLETFPPEERIYITCVKEKFGSLRVYTNQHDDGVQKIIDDAEAQSNYVCEVCGKPGKMYLIHSAYWHGVRCDRCVK